MDWIKLGSKWIDFKKGFSCTFQLYEGIFGLEWWFCRLVILLKKRKFLSKFSNSNNYQTDKITSYFWKISAIKRPSCMRPRCVIKRKFLHSFETPPLRLCFRWLFLMKNHLDVIQKYAWKLVIDEPTTIAIQPFFNPKKWKLCNLFFSFASSGLKIKQGLR